MITSTNMNTNMNMNTRIPMPINMIATNIHMNISMSTAMLMAMNIAMPMNIQRIHLTMGMSILKTMETMSIITTIMETNPIPIPTNRCAI